jgi:thioredoxin 1
LDQEEFNAKIQQNPRPVVVDIWAPWCMPCRMIEPAMEKLGHEYSERVDMWKINADEHTSLVQSLGVRSIPTLIAYHDGQEVARGIGAQPQAGLANLFEAALHGKVPPRRGLQRNDRLIRLAAGLALLGVGLYTGFTWWLLGLSAVMLFSAVYDRCPIWRAVSTRLGQLLHPGASARE